VSVSVGFPARNWRLIALDELALIAGLAATLLWQSARGTIVPRMVQVDRLGEAQAVAPAIANFRPTDPQIGGTARRKGDNEANRPGWPKRLTQSRRGKQRRPQAKGTAARCI
jgi:type IV secretion system protein VirB5